MTRTLAVTRLGAFGIACVLGVGSLLSGPAQSASARFAMNAEIRSTTADTLRSTDGRLDLHASITPKSRPLSNANYILQSHIDAPGGCASDTIFANGFDP
jgi:hypothetical protein